MSSVVIKLGSLVVKTLSKPIAVGHYSLIVRHSRADSLLLRTASRLKPENMRDSVVSV